LSHAGAGTDENGRMYGAPPALTQKPPGPRLGIALMLMIGGALLAIPTLIVGILPIIDALDSKQFPVPGTATQHLGKGTYVVYERTGSNSLGSTFDDVTVTIRPEDVTVTGPDGRVRTYLPDFYDETLTDADDRFTGAVRFRTESEGDYTIRVDAARPTTVIVARPFFDTIGRSLVWFAFTGIGGVAFIVGVILLIVGSVRRSRYRTAMTFATPQIGATQYPAGQYPAGQYPAGQYPAGWHPDPGGSGRQRYWDGTRWTEHLH
jgi:hypothetical protein